MSQPLEPFTTVYSKSYVGYLNSHLPLSNELLIICRFFFSLWVWSICRHIFKCEYKCACGYTWMCGCLFVHMCVCIYVEARGHCSVAFYKISLYFCVCLLWDTVFHWAWSSSVYLDWFSDKLQESPCLCPPSNKIITISKLTSSSLGGNHK